MDRVKLGRALGYGTRHAAKTVAAVVEAAATPDPRVQAGPAPASQDRQDRQHRPPRSTAPPPVAFAGRARAVWQPLAVFSGALWLRVTGLFFALVACTLGSGAWRLRAVLHGGTPVFQHRFWVFTAFSTLFAYFAISSFVRANLKERRAAKRT